MICLIKVGNLIDGLINILTLGWGKDIAGWVANRLGYSDCNCEKRRIFLNELFGCKEGIKF